MSRIAFTRPTWQRATFTVGRTMSAFASPHHRNGGHGPPYAAGHLAGELS